MNEDKYCLGCGVKLQDSNMLFEGYTADLSNAICSRCFRLKNYGEYQISVKSNDEYIDILKSVNDTKDLVLYVIDLLNIEKDITMIRNYISNRIVLVLTKRDILPKSIKDENIKEYFSHLKLEYKDLIVISPKKNYNVDELLKIIKLNKSSKNVYVVGHTNVGKSTLIKTLMKNYSNKTCDLTISPLPSTTLNKISIKLDDDLTLVDTPGLIDRGSIVHYVDLAYLKKINPKKEIKPKTYQVKPSQTLIIPELVRIDYIEGEKNSFTFFVSNDLKVKKYISKRHTELKELIKRTFEVGYHQDLVINGMGFVKITNKATIDVYVDKNVEIFVRDSLI